MPETARFPVDEADPIVSPPAAGGEMGGLRVNGDPRRALQGAS